MASRLIEPGAENSELNSAWLAPRAPGLQPRSSQRGSCKKFHEIADSTEPQFDLRTVPVPERDIVDGLSKPGDYVELVAEMDVLCVISNCPQINNPCNGFNPTPIQVLVWDAE